MALEQSLHDHEGFYRLLGSKVFAIMESYENAASPSALSGNPKFQDPETSRLTDCGPSGY
jgi:hypothetical protein